MRLLARVATGMLVLAVFGASVSPCPPPGEQAGTGAALDHAADTASHHAGRDERRAPHPPGCPEANAHSVSAACPCGCGVGTPATPAGPLGYALLGWIPALLAEPAHPALAAARVGAPDAPGRPLDHVPRLA